MVAVFGVVARHELIEVGALQGLGFERVMDVGAVVVDPQVFRPGLFTSGLGIEEENIRLHARGVEEPGGEPKQGVNVALFQELPPHRFARTALEEHVIGNHDGAAPVDFEQALDVLQEVQLFVLRRSPEVGALVGFVLFFQVAFLVHDGDGGLFPERRVREDEACPVTLAGGACEAVPTRDDGARVGVDPVEYQVHDAEPGGACRRIAGTWATTEEGPHVPRHTGE